MLLNLVKISNLCLLLLLITIQYLYLFKHDTDKALGLIRTCWIKRWADAAIHIYIVFYNPQTKKCSWQILDQNVEQEKMMWPSIFMYLVYNKTSAATLIQILFAIVHVGRGHVLTGPEHSSHHPLKMAPWWVQFVINYNYSLLLSLWPCDWWPVTWPTPAILTQDPRAGWWHLGDGWHLLKLAIYLKWFMSWNRPLWKNTFYC